MSKIRLLDVRTANKIAAGEVIINPASVIKELLENSIDAQSNTITIEIIKGGKELISITDNGIGIPAKDVKLAFQRHTTSKISKVEDLEKINTLGFRGEALASIAAISKVKMTTREKDQESGVFISIQGGKVVKEQELGCPRGTNIKVEDIFYNTPARYKYLKKDSIESGYIGQIVEKIALSHPEISFRFINNDKQVFHTPGNNDLFSCIYSIFGKNFAHDLIEINYTNDPLRIKGFIGKPGLSRSNRNRQIFYINQRYVQSKILSQALEDAYKGLIMVHKFPVAIFNIELPPEMLDVNVHPAKTQIRFQNESLIYLLTKQALSDRLKTTSLIPEVSLPRTKVDKDQKNHNEIQAEIPLDHPISYVNHLQNLAEAKGTSSDWKKEDLHYNRNKEKKKEKVYEDNFLGYNNKKYNKDPISPVFEKEKTIPKTEPQIIEELKLGKIIGQIFSTYIILEIPKGILLIDQHAAHERIKYNELKKQYKKNEVASQKLLVPISMNLSFQECQLIKEFSTIIHRMGFEIEEFGSNSIIIRSVPLILSQPQGDAYITQIIDYLQELQNVESIIEREDKLISMACKSAIKAHDKLDVKEMTQLVHDLIFTEQPYTCPHGRPTIIRLTQYELEKLFKRIQ
ncbi:DNA mismatch repair endonuclease MutL [Irregularibacter muris]|uniref:DNA mismatch repair protein MutL n=1 Tax=Irregularibacter muris TaxID=1796619 RepID=A0AAE3HEK3_9FIRM|nr:DNA mismatch repair endonuclease MutL [Irregularibacter muris]MCR1898070.1 DNA mismatch repair endonuclease MutL [Irregularibacter muris]